MVKKRICERDAHRTTWCRNEYERDAGRTTWCRNEYVKEMQVGQLV